MTIRAAVRSFTADYGMSYDALGVAGEQLGHRRFSQRRPAEDDRRRVGELAARVRVVGLVHEHVVTHDVDDRLRQRIALVQLDAAEHVARAGVVERIVELRLGHGMAHVPLLSTQAHEPARQPAGAALREPDAEVGVAVEQPAEDEVRGEALRSPRVRERLHRRGRVPTG